MSACIPSWSYDATYYQDVFKGGKICIQTDPTKGKGLFARVPFAAQHVVHEETALCCSQNLDDALNGIPVCVHCLKSLESPRRIVARLAKGKKKLALELPYGRLITPERPVPCFYGDEQCPALFCSVRCREAAWQGHHAVLCRGVMTQAQREAFDAFENFDWVQNGVDFSDTAVMALRIVAQTICRARLQHHGLDEAFLPFGQLISAPLDKFYFSYLLSNSGTEEKSGSDSTNEEEGGSSLLTFQEQYARFERLQSDPMLCPQVREAYATGSRRKAAFIEESQRFVAQLFALTPEEIRFFSPERWSEVMGAVLLNGQERSPLSSYDALKEALREVPGGTPALREFERRLREASVNVKELHQSARGQAIYTVGCLFNHSCSPNLQVMYSDVADETLTVVAVRDIAPGEELCISYIDEGLPFMQRQEQLYEHYLFKCSCSRCEREVQQYCGSSPPGLAVPQNV